MSRPSRLLKTMLPCFLLALVVFNASACSGEMFDRFDDTPYTGVIDIKMPEAPGTEVYERNGVSFGVSNASEGYFAARCSGIDKKLKMRVITPLETIYDYDINNQGIYEFFPYSEGNGPYSMTVYEQLEGNSYAVVYGTEFEVDMGDIKNPFTYPNQRVDYVPTMNAIELSYQLTQKYDNDADKIDILVRYVASMIRYDDDFAERVRSGEISPEYIPNPDVTLITEKGICYDYSVLLATMLRAQRIPTRLVIGYVNIDGETIKHAWNMVWNGQDWVLYDATLYGGKQTEDDSLALNFY